MKCIFNILFKLLRSNMLYYFAALLVTSSMLRSAIDKTFHFNLAIEEMQEHHLMPAIFFAALTILVQYVGSLLTIFGRQFAWLGAGALIVFTIFTIILVHDFWNMDGAQYVAHLKVVQNHLILIGGLIVCAIASAIKYNHEGLCPLSKK